jgi:Cysteine rich repeat
MHAGAVGGIRMAHFQPGDRTMKSSALLVSICLGAAAPFALADGPPPPAPSPEAINEARVACDSDIQTLCAGVQPGGGRILACLKEHKDKVSDPCKVAIVKATQTPPPN